MESGDKVVETVVVGSYVEMENEEGKSKTVKSKLSSLFWHGGSVYDAWFSCASNQVYNIIICLFHTPVSFVNSNLASNS